MGIAHPKWDEDSSAAANARKRLPELVTAYFARVRKRLAEDPVPADLHRIRLATKRLRYTLELFRPVYGSGLEGRMVELRGVQEILGELNDCVAGEHLVSKAMRGSPQRVRVKKFLAERSESLALEFRKQWAEVFDAPGREAAWVKYLGKSRPPARRT